MVVHKYGHQHGLWTASFEGSVRAYSRVGALRAYYLPIIHSTPAASSLHRAGSNDRLGTMTHDEKVAFLLDDLARKGIGRYTVAPPIYRLLWRLGIEVKPPLFASFLSLVAITGVGYGVLLGLFMWFFVWQSSPLSDVAGTAALAGVLFGLFMGLYYRWRARKLGLSRWEDYPAS